ncbi:MAG: hypothetical protein QG567_138 [Campylobacterota bacterium]|nr:hypothetical protein [Campylobacterota bacterium]
MDNATIFIFTIIIAVVVGYMAHKNHWKIADIF